MEEGARCWLPSSKSSPQRQQTRDASHSNNNKAADHGERIIVDSQHSAPHRDIASDQPDCNRLGLNSCGLDATIPFSTVARRWQTRVMLGLVSRDQVRDASRSSPSRNRLPYDLGCRRDSEGTHRLFETAAQRHGFVGHDADAVGHVA